MTTQVRLFTGEAQSVSEAVVSAQINCNTWLEEFTKDDTDHEPKVVVRMILPSIAMTANRVCVALTVHYEVIKN